MSQNPEWEGKLMSHEGPGAVFLFFFSFLVSFYIPWHSSSL